MAGKKKYLDLDNLQSPLAKDTAQVYLTFLQKSMDAKDEYAQQKWARIAAEYLSQTRQAERDYLTKDNATQEQIDDLLMRLAKIQKRNIGDL